MDITPSRIKEIDQDDMWGKLVAFPDHWREAMELSLEADWLIEKERVRNICLSGMGGSAIGADLLRAYTHPSSRLPVFVNRSYEIPAWVGEETLFVACSYSGNTEETLSALELAKEAGAQVVAVTSGGALLV